MDLVLILARELASNLATATFVVDPEGTLIFYNEAAEGLLGESYADTGELLLGEWGSKWSPEDMVTGERIPVEGLPLSVALAEHRPSHLAMSIRGSDDVRRKIAVTAFPLFSREDESVGAVAIFWEHSE